MKNYIYILFTISRVEPPAALRMRDSVLMWVLVSFLLVYIIIGAFLFVGKVSNKREKVDKFVTSCSFPPKKSLEGCEKLLNTATKSLNWQQFSRFSHLKLMPCSASLYGRHCCKVPRMCFETVWLRTAT